MREDELLRARAAHQRRTTAVWPGCRQAAAAASLFAVGALLGASLAPGSTFRPVPSVGPDQVVQLLATGAQRAATLVATTIEPHIASIAPAVPSAPHALEAPPELAAEGTVEQHASLEFELAPAQEHRAGWQAQNLATRPYARRIERWRPLVRELLAEAWNEGRLSGHAAKLDDDLLLALIEQESSGDPEAISWAGAVGLMQVMPFTFAEMHHGDKALGDHMELHTMLEVPSNVRAGIRYLALAMQAHEGNLYWALASYNAGIEAAAAWRAVGLYAVPPIGGYEETANYAQVILRNYLSRRPDVKMHVPDPMPYEHVPGAATLLIEAGLW